MRGTLVMALDRKGYLQTACWNDIGSPVARQNEPHAKSGIPAKVWGRVGERRSTNLSSAKRLASPKEARP